MSKYLTGIYIHIHTPATTHVLPLCRYREIKAKVRVREIAAFQRALEEGVVTVGWLLVLLILFCCCLHATCSSKLVCCVVQPAIIDIALHHLIRDSVIPVVAGIAHVTVAEGMRPLCERGYPALAGWPGG